jgi:hypothetical protein
MKPGQSDSKPAQAYHVGFVVVLTLMFLFVMMMSSNLQGFGKFEESFFQRNVLIQNYNRLRIKLGDRVLNNVLIGKNGWIEFTGGRNLDAYQNVLKFSPEDLKTFAQTIRNCHEYAREQDITFLMVVAPNKASIYSDKLPDQIQRLSDVSQLDQLNKYLRKQNIPQVLDLRPALLDARKSQETYYPVGTHWNAYGAYVAYETIINALSQDHPNLEPYSAKFFRIRYISPGASVTRDKDIALLIKANYLVPESALFSTRDISGLVNKVDFPDADNGYHEISWIPDSDLPSLLIFHDSFGNADLNDFLSLNFSKAFYIHRDAASSFLNKQIINQFSPDILIYQVVERNLKAIQNDLVGCATE